MNCIDNKPITDIDALIKELLADDLVPDPEKKKILATAKVNMMERTAGVMLTKPEAFIHFEFLRKLEEAIEIVDEKADLTVDSKG